MEKTQFEILEQLKAAVAAVREQLDILELRVSELEESAQQKQEDEPVVLEQPVEELVEEPVVESAPESEPQPVDLPLEGAVVPPVEIRADEPESEVAEMEAAEPEIPEMMILEDDIPVTEPEPEIAPVSVPDQDDFPFGEESDNLPSEETSKEVHHEEDHEPASVENLSFDPATEPVHEETTSEPFGMADAFDITLDDMDLSGLVDNLEEMELNPEPVAEEVEQLPEPEVVPEPVEEAPIEEIPVEEIPIEEVPVEELPVEDAPVEELEITPEPAPVAEIEIIPEPTVVEEVVPEPVPQPEPAPVVEEEPMILADAMAGFPDRSLIIVDEDGNEHFAPKMSINDIEKPKKAVMDVFSEKLRWKTDMPGTPVKNIISAISLNDRALFINTLFRQNPILFTNTIAQLNTMGSFEEALTYIAQEFPEWNMKGDGVYRFMMAVRRKLK